MSTENKQEQAVPTKEDLITFLTEQIDVKKLQVELQNLNTQLAKGRAEELQALNFIANMTSPKEEAVPHTVTQEDLDNNPELVEAGVKVGDEVMVAAPEQKKLKRKKP